MCPTRGLRRLYEKRHVGPRDFIIKPTLGQMTHIQGDDCTARVSNLLSSDSFTERGGRRLDKVKPPSRCIAFQTQEPDLSTVVPHLLTAKTPLFQRTAF